MASRGKVSPNARAKIFRLAREGVSRRAIAAELAKDGVAITHQAVTALLKNAKGPKKNKPEAKSVQGAGKGRGWGAVRTRGGDENEGGTSETKGSAETTPREPSKEQKSALESIAGHLVAMREEQPPTYATLQALGAYRDLMVTIDLVYARVNDAILGDQKLEPVTAAMRELRAQRAAYYALLPAPPAPPPDPVADPHNVAALAIVEHYLDTELEGFEARFASMGPGR